MVGGGLDALARRGRSSACRGSACGAVPACAALAEAVAVAVHLEDVDVVGETVEQRPGEALGAEGLGPLVEGEVGGDQGGAAFVALGDRLEQQLGAGLRYPPPPD